MQQTQRHRRHLPRATHAASVALAALVAAAAVTVAWPSCETHEAPGAGELDPGPTFGAEIVVTILGRGRVVAGAGPAAGGPGAGAIDCPGSCFARILLDDPTADGAPVGVTLSADATPGAHFDHWELEVAELGVRARGPAQCSPMRRMTEKDSRDGSGFIDSTSSRLALRFGETTGTPPAGREAECAAFTTVPVAYALTATFVDDQVPGVDAGPDAGMEPLLEAPSGFPGRAREIGVLGGNVYWRFEQSTGRSGVAVGLTAGGPANVVVQPLDTITMFDVDRHVVFQHANGTIEAIEGGELIPRVIATGAPSCTALASDSTSVYCRTNAAVGSTLYAWSIFGGGLATTVYTLPRGLALAVDESSQRFYFSDDPGGLAGQASVKSAPRLNGDGGAPSSTVTLADNQTSPRSLTAGVSYLFWLDARGGNVFAATAGTKFSFSTPQVSQSGSTVSFIAADPVSSSTYWIGISGGGAGASSILRAFPNRSSPPIFRAGITGLGGIAVDANDVYWTETNGNVYRLPKNPFDE